MKKIQIRSLLTVAVIFMGSAVFSMANATKAEEIKAEGIAFLAENAKNPNVITTPSGLQYIVLSPGVGVASPADYAHITINYKGTFINGKAFTTSYAHGKRPIKLLVVKTIMGLSEGFKLMKEKSHFRFFLPSHLGYAEKGHKGVIPPNAALIYEVELLKIE